MTALDPSLPLVSIVTPSFNQGQFIRETIESVLNQDYPNIEYWVMDGGSTDETVAILKEYETDPRFHWVSQPDTGQSNAINKGWMRCQGEILAWLNSDDTYLPGAIRSQVNALLSHPDCGVVYADGLFIDHKSQPLYKCHATKFSILELLRLTIPLQPTVFIRREVYQAVGSLNENFRCSMDSEYWVRAAKLTNFWYEPILIATYRLHENSKTVGSYQGFYQDWLNIADTFFNDPSLCEEYRKYRKRVYAAIYSRIACIEAENGSIENAWQYLRKSVLQGGISPRIVKSLLLVIEYYLPWQFTTRFVELWTRLRSRMFSQVS